MAALRAYEASRAGPTARVVRTNREYAPDYIFRRVEGTFQAPLFMTADAPASRLNLVNGVPTQNGYATVPFVVDTPRLAVVRGREHGALGRPRGLPCDLVDAGDVRGRPPSQEGERHERTPAPRNTVSTRSPSRRSSSGGPANTTRPFSM